MRFGTIGLGEALGAVLAHSEVAQSAKDGPYKIAKGTELTEDHLTDLAAAGIAQVTVAQLSPSDVPEDSAAAALAAVLPGRAAGLELGSCFPGTCIARSKCLSRDSPNLSCFSLNAALRCESGDFGAGSLSRTWTSRWPCVFCASRCETTPFAA